LEDYSLFRREVAVVYIYVFRIHDQFVPSIDGTVSVQLWRPSAPITFICSSRNCCSPEFFTPSSKVPRLCRTITAVAESCASERFLLCARQR